MSRKTPIKQSCPLNEAVAAQVTATETLREPPETAADDAAAQPEPGSPGSTPTVAAHWRPRNLQPWQQHSQAGCNTNPTSRFSLYSSIPIEACVCLVPFWFHVGFSGIWAYCDSRLFWLLLAYALTLRPVAMQRSDNKNPSFLA